MSAGPADVLDGLVAGGQEPGGAVAVVRDGVVEVDHCAGTRGGAAPWTTDTLVMTFSVAKPFAALAFLDAVAEGEVGLDQLVTSVWPEFGQAGKGATTMRHLLAHQAGLPAFPEDARGVDYDDRAALVDLLAAATPVHAPGAGVAEHALTYGHLLDEVLRRATGEPLAERFARVAAAGGWDLHLRVEARDLGRVATLVEPTGRWRSDYLADPRWGPALGRPPGLLEVDVLNSDRFRGTPFPAVALHATALSLASFYDDVTERRVSSRAASATTCGAPMSRPRRSATTWCSTGPSPGRSASRSTRRTGGSRSGWVGPAAVWPGRSPPPAMARRT